MARSLRIQFQRAWYHVMNRGAGKRHVFHNDASRMLFLHLLGEIHCRYQVEIHAYCLMNNHYHLYVCTPLANLSRAMRHLNGVYTQRHNKLFETDGPLFRGRYKSILVDTQEYHLQLSRYIHLNPVVAGIVQHPEQYAWSSYASFLTDKKAPHWLFTHSTLSHFGDDQPVEKYKIFIDAGIDDQINSFFSQSKRAPILGRKTFIKKINEKYVSCNVLSNEIPDAKYLQLKPTEESIIRQVCQYFNIDYMQLKVTSRCPGGNWPRYTAIYLMAEFCGTTHSVIAKIFTKLSVKGVSTVISRVKCRRMKSSEAHKHLTELEELIQLMDDET